MSFCDCGELAVILRFIPSYCFVTSRPTKCDFGVATFHHLPSYVAIVVEAYRLASRPLHLRHRLTSECDPPHSRPHVLDDRVAELAPVTIPAHGARVTPHTNAPPVRCLLPRRFWPHAATGPSLSRSCSVRHSCRRCRRGRS